MRILLINPPHLSIGSRMPDEHLPPLGLLSIGGPLIDQGHEVQLLDAEFGPMTFKTIVERTKEYKPDIVLLGHSGSTSAQPIISEITWLLKTELPSVIIIIGGVFPTYHWKEILMSDPQIDFIVCGEGEETILKLMNYLVESYSTADLPGIAYMKDCKPYRTKPANIIQYLDNYRIGWELMGSNKYTYWGKKKAVVVQFSRGCRHKCTYCGQTLFWRKWRHRNPESFAKEIAMLHKTYGIEVFNFADENPATDKEAWKRFLIALIAENIHVILVGSTRADNIVRDADILHLYKKAGFERFLLGIENCDENILENIKKNGNVRADRESIRLLRKNGILSMVTYVFGFGNETTIDFVKNYRKLRSYDPDQIQLMYVTPHRWTPYYKEVKSRKIIQSDQRKWDYKHQVLATDHLSPFMIILYVKLVELLMQIRLKSLKRLFFHPDKSLRKAMKWYYKIGRKVWFYEWFCFIFRDKTSNSGLNLEGFWK